MTLPQHGPRPDSRPRVRPDAHPDTGMSRHLARVMDDLVTIPGTRIGIGLDLSLIHI